MTATIAEYGYLETPYLSEFPYLNAAREDALGLQFDVTSYVDKLKGLQLEQKIIKSAFAGVQFDGFITQNNPLATQYQQRIDASKTFGVQTEQVIEFDGPIGLQWEGIVSDTIKRIAMQHTQLLGKIDILAWQMNVANTQEKSLATQWIERFYTDETFAVQFYAKLIADKPIALGFEGFNDGGVTTRGLEFRASKVLPHKIAGDYLNDEPYLSEYQYLAPVYHVPMGVQFDGRITKDKLKGTQFEGHITKQRTHGIQTLGYITKEPKLGLQFDGRITKEKLFGDQFEGVITKEKNYALQFEGFITKDKMFGVQFDSVREVPLAVQFRAALYNTTNLRILLDFPSRGVDGLNWTATSTAPSSSDSFSINNLNTDIVEQYWRTEDGITNATITCDTQLVQGVFTDTVALLNHNLSGSAQIQFQGSDDPTFTNIPFNTFIDVDTINAYWISPKLPLVAYRYWRFLIQDGNNPDQFLRIGTIVFGSAIIFSNESFVDRVRFGRQQFIDKVYTEGFTNVSNDRGKKAFLELEFKSLRYGRLNFRSLNEVFDVAGVTLKCLWMPVPLQPTRFTLFGKLNELPSEEHNYKGEDSDFVDFALRVDESL